jgi:hypothetical protein
MRFSLFSSKALVPVFLTLLAIAVPSAFAQQGSQGTVTVTVLDSTERVIQGADLVLTDVLTNTVRHAETQDAGNYTFVNLNIGNYKLSIAKTGFETLVYKVEVQAARVTDIKAELKVGAAQQIVEVVGLAAPLVETTSSAIATTIDTKLIEDLPLGTRDLTALSHLVPGYTGIGNSRTGTWNGLPVIAQGNNIDGVMGSASRMKFSGNAQSAVTPRLENIAEMTVQTDQMDLNQGFGQASMQLNYVTRRGSNSFHGRVYEDFRSSALNAGPWSGSRKPKNHQNELGGSVGGPILKDKLFFFGSFSTMKIPGAAQYSNLFMTDSAQSGIFSYVDSNNMTQTVNLFNLAQTYNTSHGASLATSVNAQIATELGNINGTLKNGSIDTSLASSGSPNLNMLRWNQLSPSTYYYPTFRIDYNVSSRNRINLAYNQTWSDRPGINQGLWPGDGLQAGEKDNNYTVSLGVETTIKPTLINQFRAGFLYYVRRESYNAPGTYKTATFVNWNYTGVANKDWRYPGFMSGANYYTPITPYYPVLSMNDTLSWIKGKHSIAFGFNWYREQDHYWNGPLGYPNVDLGLVVGDPALNAFTTADFPNATQTQFTEAKQLYAILAGRIADVNGQTAYDKSTGNYFKPLQTAAYNLDELQKAWGLFVQDSYKLKPNLTLNYGLRWDFTGDNHDLTGAYHGATPDTIYGPSGIGNLFKPGTLTGNMNPLLYARPHQYAAWNKSPQPFLGFAWSPRSEGGFWKKLTGDDALVVRGSYAIRRFTEPQQYFWDQASDVGAFFYQTFKYQGVSGGAPGTFDPGSLQLGDTFDYTKFNLSPTQYMKSEPISDFALVPGGVGVYGMDPHIAQPYSQSWTLGIQRQLGRATALEIRYNGNHTIHQWLNRNVNEVNVFENGFLTEFKAAANNLAIYTAANPNCASAGTCSFANNGLSGQVPLPVMQAGFAAGDFTNTTFTNWLQTGQVGSLAYNLAGGSGPNSPNGGYGNGQYFCNLVGANFSGPCGTQGFSTAGTLPINFFQVNPFQAGNAVGYMTAAGYSNYHALQLDLRQQTRHGLQFDANYTWAHNLGVVSNDGAGTAQNWQGNLPLYTNRSLRLNYGPTTFDMRHVLHINASYDLPFGRGRMFGIQNSALNHVIGGWTISTIYQFQTGAPFVLNGGNMTFNDFGDGGVVLNGVTAGQLQNSVGIRHTASGTYAVDPTLLGKVQSNATPGVFGGIVYLHGPHQTQADIAISKAFSITERVRFKFQTEMLNAFNHPFFAMPDGNVADGPGAFGTTYGPSSPTYDPRRIEFRANIEF